MEEKQILEFQKMIFYWWAGNKRDLPWRHTRDPYKILVSEIMLQQTQVLRVIPKYAEFIEAYPTVACLAKASTADVLKIWKGLGYNRRALYLKQSVALGVIPKTEVGLMRLPGVGKYTARAVLIFAFGKNIAAVDTNIRQIITHYFFQDKLQKEKVIQEAADQLLPVGKPWEWHQALMDYGAIEMPKLKIVKTKNPSKVSFKGSNRYYRGKVMDILRERTIRELDLCKELHKPLEFFISIIDGLVRDGLIKRKKGILQLPD